MGKAAETVTRGAAAISTGGLSEIERTRGDQSIVRSLETGARQFGDDISGASAADAAGRAAMAQAAEARASREAILREAGALEDKTMALAKASPEELRAHEASLMAADKQLKSDEQLLASVDPALMEASSQVLKLLRGERSAALAPLDTQRAEQRKQLLDSLRQQYGPGAETSSLGLKALRDFDMETSSLTANTQQ